MTDDRSMGDATPDEDPLLDDRLRDGLAALVRETGDPPVLPSAAPLAVSHSGRRWAAVAAVILLAAGASFLVRAQGHGHRRSGMVTANKQATTRPKPDQPLEGTRWALLEVRKAGSAIVLRQDRPIGLRFLRTCTGPNCPSRASFMTASDGCNGVRRTYRIERDEVVLGKAVGGSTLMKCGGPLVELLGTVYRADRLTFAIDGDRLHVRVPGVDASLTYVVASGPFAPTTGQVVDQGHYGGAQYRLVWNKGSLDMEVADSNTILWGGGGGLGDDPGRINDMRGSVRGRPYLFAIVPAASARVVYEPVGGAPQDLTIHRVDSKTSAVVGQFVHDGPVVWSLVAYDADGIELHRDRWGARSDFSKYSLEEIIAKAKLQRCCGKDGPRITFADGEVPMSAGSSPLEPTAPRDPREGMKDASVVTFPDGSKVATGTVRDQTAVRFDCLGLRYEVQAPLDATAQTLEVARRLNRVTGCPDLTIG
ncbi:MAG: hypothetical protein JWM89_2188 [Acidimicrobiales bacterium]|nr:hypothetical protein [Acidimicrobiales bacterium]